MIAAMTEHELARADREFEESIAIPPSPFIWLMDSECCDKCGAALDCFESVICTDCLENAWYDEEQARYAGWDDEYEDEQEVPGE